MRVVAFGTYDVESHPRVGVLLDGLRESGFEVVECNAPLGLGTASRVRILQRPWLLPRLAVRLLRRWTTLTRQARRLRRETPPDAVLVGYLGHFDVLLARRLFRDVPIVLDHLIGAADTARDRGETSRLKQGALARLDRAALGAADVVLVDTEEQRQTLSADAAAKAVVVPVGARRSWFAAPRPAHDGPLRVVFFGLFTPLQGTRVIGAALARLADSPVDIDVTLVGTGQELRRGPRAAPAACLASPGSTGSQEPSCRDWWPVTTSAWASSAPTPRRCAWCRPRSTRARPPAVPSSPRTPCRNGGCSAPARSWCHRATPRHSPTHWSGWRRTAHALARAAAAAYDTACRDFAPREVVAPLAALLRARRQEHA